MESKRPSWSSKYSFILAAIGSAVGLGNIWRFPYVMGQNGGAVFLITYLFFISTVCFIPMITEIIFGKKTQKECIGAYESVKPGFKYIGILNPITAIIVPSFYFVIGGWIIYYLYRCIFGGLAAETESFLAVFVQRPWLSCFCTISFLFLCVFYAARGIKRGIEVVNNVMMPLLALILIILACAALNLPNASAGIEYIFKPDFSKFNAEMILAALGQAFFTLSVGMGCLLTYGSYVQNDEHIVKTAYTIIFSSSAFSVFAGIMIFPAVFSFGLEPDAGAGLVFVTLPRVFEQIAFGNVIAAAFFFLLFCAAVTSGISMLEVPFAALTEQLKISRTKAAAIIFSLISTLSIPATLSFGILSNVKFFGKTFFELLDFSTSNILLPLNTLLLCIVAGHFLKIKGEMIFKRKFLCTAFDFGLKILLPVILTVLTVSGLK